MISLTAMNNSRAIFVLNPFLPLAFMIATAPWIWLAHPFRSIPVLVICSNTVSNKIVANVVSLIAVLGSLRE